MSEIKPVYQRYCSDGKWLDINQARYVEEIEADCAETRIIYPAAALEALQAENAKLKEAAKYAEHIDATPVNQRETMLYDTLVERDTLRIENAAQAKEIQQWKTVIDCNEQIRAAQAKQEPSKDIHEAITLLSAVFDAWENGTDCYDDFDGVSGSFIGKAFNLDDEIFKRCCSLLNRINPPRNVSQQPAQDPNALSEMEARKDAAYLERNQAVAALAKCFPSGIAKTAIDGWSEDWHGCVYIDLPTGQASWHYHDSQAYLFADLPAYKGKWDGHTTEEKYARIARLQPAQEPAAYRVIASANGEVVRDSLEFTRMSEIDEKVVRKSYELQIIPLYSSAQEPVKVTADDLWKNDALMSLNAELAAQAKRISDLENELVEFNEFKKIRDSQMQELRKQMP